MRIPNFRPPNGIIRFKGLIIRSVNFFCAKQFLKNTHKFQTKHFFRQKNKHFGTIGKILTRLFLSFFIQQNEPVWTACLSSLDERQLEALKKF